MRVSFGSKGGFDNSEKWLKSISTKNPTNVASSIAQEGVRKLSASTPRDTGETASGWKATVEKTKTGMEVSWINTAHPELEVNLAKLIELGHGTKNGGYVSPRPYIKQSMNSVLETAGDKIAGELFK